MVSLTSVATSKHPVFNAIEGNRNKPKTCGFLDVIRTAWSLESSIDLVLEGFFLNRMISKIGEPRGFIKYM